MEREGRRDESRTEKKGLTSVAHYELHVCTLYSELCTLDLLMFVVVHVM